MAQTMRKFRKAATILLVAVAAFIGTDWGLRYTLDSRPTLQTHAATVTTPATAGRLVVFLTGTQSSGVKLSVPFIPLWSHYGDVVVVEYSRQRFVSEDVLAAVTAYLGRPDTKPYTRLTLIGASLGGPLSTDLALALPADSPVRHIDFMLADTPTGLTDLRDPRAGLIARAPFGPLSNALFTKPFWTLGFRPLPPDQLGLGALPSELSASHALAGTYPLSGWVDEVHFITTHERPRLPAASITVSGVFLQSTRDDVVLPIAYLSWNQVFGGRLPLLRVDSTHIGFLEYPVNWSQAFIQAFALLG